MEAMHTLSQTEADKMQSDDAASFRQAVPPGAQLKGSAPNPAVIRLVHEMLADTDSVRRGDGLSRILRTIDAHRSFYLEYVCGSPPYGQLTPHLKVTLRNVTERTIKVIRSTRVAPVYDADGTVSNERRNVLEVYQRVAPGEELSVDADRAVHLLQKHSKQGMQPQLWHSRKHKDELVEVGYKANWIGEDQRGEAEPIEIESPPKVADDPVRTKGRRRVS